MAIDAVTILDKIVSHALTLGIFETVNGHEPKAAPGNGLSCAVWVDSIQPIRKSGLASTSARMVLNARIFSNMLQEPQDAIDPNLVGAVDQLLTLYSGDFELGGNVRNVDLLGEFGEPLSARAGYLKQDEKLFRVMTITIPLVLNDVWEQAHG